MALRYIVQDGDPILKKVCRPVTKFDDRLATLLDDMKETLADANGYGLAGPQVGVMRRVFISIDERDIPEGQEDTAPLKFIEFVNPEILEEMPLRLQCDCSREYIERVLLSMGENEIRDMIEKQNGCEVECHFCRKHYRFSGEELEALLAQAHKENDGDE